MAKELVFKLKVIDESGNVVEKAINKQQHVFVVENPEKDQETNTRTAEKNGEAFQP